ncbi:uncharacterized protein LOC113854979 [Abrus precatorius]|uniref:Uncharacterized protein LOC113854979 n=1 Tax=Abrus precatorius TaxID=3816 RepID=A0A8B8KEI5_ABRPR|nr:uncharacterized protein LOC113854979 [Abrus precatorius]
MMVKEIELIEEFRDMNLAKEVRPGSLYLEAATIHNDFLVKCSAGRCLLARHDETEGLPKTRNNHDAIWVIIDRLTKAAHFLLINTKYKLERLAELYVQEIVRLHGVPTSVVSDRDLRGAGPRCVGMKRRGDSVCAEYDPKVSPVTGVGRALKSRKLSPKFIGPFEMLSRISPTAYQIVLPPNLSNLHLVFHVSQLRQYVSDPSHMIDLDLLRGKDISLVKVIWSSSDEGDVTWETESRMRIVSGIVG